MNQPMNGPLPKNLKTKIVDGQRYFDEPVYDEILAKPLAFEINRALAPRLHGPGPVVRRGLTLPRMRQMVNNGQAEEMVRAFAATQKLPFLPVASRIKMLSHYMRVPLRWMKPDGKGGLVPRVK